jgi:hypothetical protein
MRTRRVLRTVLFVSLLTGLLSCGLFEPREPNRPPPLPSGCRSLTGSLAIFANIEDPSVGYGRVSGLTCYGSMLDTSFVFHADPQDSAQALPLTPFIGWDETIESRVNSGVASDQDFIQVQFLDEYANPIFPDQSTEIRFREYMIRFSSKSLPDTLRFTGLADMTFRRGTDGQWRITDWVDHRGSVNDSTWGLLRRQYRVGF